MKDKRKAARKPQVAPQGEREPRLKPISLHPLTPEEALRRAMQAPPMPPTADGGKDKK